ncbi:MAG TPA: TonB-dependent receptor [Steroidobacteraceae bacterium]|nr:TonB-dependent receptor [Steroidobacteraceae bacterium]
MKVHNTNRRGVTLAFVIVAALAAGSAAAQQLEELTVTARKMEERLLDVPIAVSAFTSKTLQEAGTRDVFDVALLTPGFSFERLNRYGVQGGVSRPVIRGMSNILGEGNASVFVDGILFSDSILAFPFDIVDRAEVIKGPQAALFGRATFAGAINLVTKKGSNEPENKVSLRAAQYGDYEANMLSRGPITEDRLFYMLHARYYTFDGMYDNTLDGVEVGDEESYNVNGSLEYRPSESFSALVSAGYSRDNDGLAAITLQDRFANNCYLNVPRQYYCGEVGEQSATTLDRAGLQGTEGVDRDSTRVSLQLEWDFDGFSVVSNSGAFFTDTDYGYDSTYQGGTALGPTTVPGAPGYVRTATDPVRTGSVMRVEVTARDEWSTELRIQSAQERRLRWLGGVYYYESERTLEERHFLATAPTIFNGETRVENWAVFGSLGFDLTDRWDATVELRYAEDTIGNFKTIPAPVLIEQSFESWSPRVTTSFKITPDSMVYANAALGNKPGVINADPRFPPEIQFAEEEEAWSYELGTKNLLLDGRLSVNAAVYYIDWTNQQLTTTFFFPTGGTQSYITNAGKSEVKGFEFEMQWRVTEHFSAGLNYAYTDAEFVELLDTEAQQLFGDPSLEGYQLPGVPKNEAGIFGKLSFNVADLGLGYVRVDADYSDEKFDQVFNLASTGTQELVNLTLGLDSEHWSMQLFVKNLTDDRTPSSVTRYVDQLNLNVPQFTNSNPDQNNVPGTTTLERAFFYPLPPKRQYGATISYRF